MSGVTKGVLDPLPRVNGGYCTAPRVRRGCGGVGRSRPNGPRTDGAPARLPGSVSGGPLGVGPAPSLPQPQGSVSGFPPRASRSRQRRWSSWEKPPAVPGGLQPAEAAGLPLAAFFPHKNPALRLGLGSFPAATAPARPTPETGEEEEGNVARQTQLPASRASLPVPARIARTEPLPQVKAGTGNRAGQTAGKSHPHILFLLLLLARCPQRLDVGEAVPALPSGPRHRAAELTSIPPRGRRSSGRRQGRPSLPLLTFAADSRRRDRRGTQKSRL